MAWFTHKVSMISGKFIEKSIQFAAVVLQNFKILRKAEKVLFIENRIHPGLNQQALLAEVNAIMHSDKFNQPIKLLIG